MTFGNITLHLQYQTVWELSSVKEVLECKPSLFVGYWPTAKPDQMTQNLASDQILPYLLTGVSFKI